MPNFGKRIDGPGGRRRTSRESVILAGSALSLEASRSVVVTDVSPSGAKLQGRDLPDAGTSVLLAIGDSEVLGKIIWRGRDECGIGFDTLLDREMTERLKQEGGWAKVMGIPAV